MTEAAEVAVVTGAGRGIGRAVALALGGRGMRVALLARTKSELSETSRLFAETARAPATSLIVPCDVRSAEGVAAASQRVLEAFGAPLVVVNNAGVVRRAPLAEMGEDDWDDVVETNLKGTFLVTRAFLPSMLASGKGRVVNVASISATLGTKGQTAYNAAKWGVVGLTKSLAEELRGTGLQALAVLPGAVSTSMLVGSGFAPQMTPEAVAETLVYAALDAPSAMNGSAIEIFGP